MPATVELSVPPLRKQPGLPPSSRDATASFSSPRNSVLNASNETAPLGGVKLGTQYGVTLSRPSRNTAQCPAGSLNTPLNTVRGAGMQWKYR